MVATSSRIETTRDIGRLDRIVFIRQCELKHAYTEQQRAALAGVDRGTVRRWLDGKSRPMLPKAQLVAQNLDSTVTELWPAAKRSVR